MSSTSNASAAAGAAEQAHADVRCDWGADGLAALRSCRTFVIVDVLSFSTCTTVAIEAQARLIPWAGSVEDEAAIDLARSTGARIAARQRDPHQLSLSPRSLQHLQPDETVLLPSPNGSTLSTLAAEHGTVAAGCLRNATAVAQWLRQQALPIAVIAAGERWPSGTLRCALEDQLGAGAICAALAAMNQGLSLSAEARYWAGAFRATESVGEALRDCVSGRELITRGFADDLPLAAALDQSEVVPVLRGRAFSSSSSQ